jgi:hypothetical protein
MEMAPEMKEVSDFTATIGRQFLRIGQMSFAVAVLIPREAHR